jgi:flagellar export protein FliJ
MPRFRFRLATLRRLREITRDELRSRLATAYEAERILAEQRHAIDVESLALVASRRHAVEQTPLNVTALLESQRYQFALEAQARTLAEQADKLAAEVERRRLAVVEADREVRVLDKLEERQRAQHGLAAARAENKRLDEVAAVRWEEGNP